MGHALSQILHAFAEADDIEKIFMAKWDIKDGFWHMNCEAGEEYNLSKTLLGFNFDGKRKTMWLEEEKRAKLLPFLHSWLRVGSLNRGIPFGEFKSVIAKLWHAFTALPGSRDSFHRATVS